MLYSLTSVGEPDRARVVVSKAQPGHIRIRGTLVKGIYVTSASSRRLWQFQRLDILTKCIALIFY